MKNAFLSVLNSSLELVKIRVEQLKKENEELKKENERLRGIIERFAEKTLDNYGRDKDLRTFSWRLGASR